MIRGSLVALVTPMKADLSLDLDALHSLVEWHIEQGTHGIVAVGTTGESATLNVGEHIEVIRKVVNQVAGRVPVIAGTGANSTQEALELTQRAQEAGVDACLLVTPYYNKPTQEGLFLHHEYIAKRVAIPQILYNVPGRTAVDMLPETVARLAAVDNIIGIKEATGDMQRLQDIITHLENASPQGRDKDFLLFSGDDGSALEFMRLGGHGDISVTANVAPSMVAQMCELIAQGKVEEASAIDEKLQPLHSALFLEANPIPVKWAVAALDMMENHIRLPLTPLSAGFQEPLRRAMHSAQLLQLVE